MIAVAQKQERQSSKVMLSIFKRKPKFSNQAFADLAQMLTFEEADPTYKRELLDPNKLDFSLESLRHIDDYLETVRADQPVGADLFRIVMRTGAYVGEVVRKNSPVTYDWVFHDEAVQRIKAMKCWYVSLGTAGILWTTNDSICFPLAKVGKYIENGSEDSVHAFVTIVCK